MTWILSVLWWRSHYYIFFGLSLQHLFFYIDCFQYVFEIFKNSCTEKVLIYWDLFQSAGKSAEPLANSLHPSDISGHSPCPTCVSATHRSRAFSKHPPHWSCNTLTGACQWGLTSSYTGPTRSESHLRFMAFSGPMDFSLQYHKCPIMFYLNLF